MTGPDDRDSQPDWGHPPPEPAAGTTPEPHTCDGGWIDRDTAQPCLTCKPWLTHPTVPGAQPRKAT